MQPHEESALKTHLDRFDSQQLRNIKAHADAANSEEHHSFKEIAKWVAGILGVIPTTGLIWKAIKVIQRH